MLGQGPRTRRNVAWTWPTHTDPSVVEDQLIFPRMAPRAPASAPLGPKLNPLLTSYEPRCCIIKGTSCNWTRPALLPFCPRLARYPRFDDRTNVSPIILTASPLFFEQSLSAVEARFRQRDRVDREKRGERNRKIVSLENSFNAGRSRAEERKREWNFYLI